MGIKPILLFDWDGVIVDSNAWKWGGAWREVFRDESNLADLMEQVLVADVKKKLRRDELVAEVLRDAEIGGIVPSRSAEEYISDFGEAVRSGVMQIGLFPGAKQTLTMLRNSGYRMYVISATAQEDLGYLAKELGVAHYFAGLYGGPISKRSHVETIKGAVGEAKYVVIGDGEGDRQLAEYINCMFVGVINDWNQWRDDSTIANKVRSVVDLPGVLDSQR